MMYTSEMKYSWKADAGQLDSWELGTWAAGFLGAGHLGTWAPGQLGARLDSWAPGWAAGKINQQHGAQPPAISQCLILASIILVSYYARRFVVSHSRCSALEQGWWWDKQRKEVANRLLSYCHGLFGTQTNQNI
jgi:hypothetical protein